MKKVLSLLLVCTMILSLIAVSVVSAAGEAFTVTGGKWEYYEDEDLGEYVSSFTAGETGSNSLGSSTVTTIDLEVKATTVSSGGFITIDYDETKVKPVRYNTAATKAYDSFSDTNYTKFVQVGGGISPVESTASTYPDTESGAVIFTWTGKVDANATIAYVHFVLLDGVTTDDFDADTFKLSTDSAFLTKYTRTYSAGYDPATGSAVDVSAATKFTYPNSTKGTTPDPTFDWDDFTDDETADWNSGFKYVSEIADDGTQTIVESGYNGKKIVCFGKNASGAALTDKGYGITIGNNSYAGKGAVPEAGVFAIVLIDSNADTKVGDTYYSYSIWNGTEDTVVKTGLEALIVNAAE